MAALAPLSDWVEAQLKTPSILSQMDFLHALPYENHPTQPIGRHNDRCARTVL